MSIPRPKILTALTVPTGGWTFKIYFSVSSHFDTAKTCTIAAGTYYLSWDSQADDFFRAVSNAIYTQVATLGGSRNVFCYLNSSKKFIVKFYGTDFQGTTKRWVKLAWTESSAGVPLALGFNGSADQEITAADDPGFTAIWQHSHAWYSSEDCLLESLATEDINVVTSPQAIGLSGVVKTQMMGSRYRNELRLQYLPRTLTFSKGVSYGASSVAPYAQNVPLECWWYEARKGTPFRVYRNSSIDTATAIDQGTISSSSPTTCTDSGKSWATDPQAYKGMACYIPRRDDTYGFPGKFYIASHTSTVLTSGAAAPSPFDWALVGSLKYYIVDHRYQTYVLNTKDMEEFAPDELDAIDRYNIRIPVLRYVP